MRRHRKIAVRILMIGVLALSHAARAQSGAPALAPSTDEARAKAAELRKQKLQADINQLVQMAAQLKTMVDGVKKDELSMQVIREADRIERLARTMKETAKQ